MNGIVSRRGGRAVRRTVPALLVAATLVVGSVAATSTAWANNDPHRVFLGQDPFDIAPDVCGYTIHVEIPVNREYGTISTTDDGSTLIKITGSLVWELTNTTNGNTITLNISGPGNVLLPIDTTLAVIEGHGLNAIYVTNGADFGVPNFMYSSGLLEFTTDLSNDTIVSMDRKPHVLLDVCAALA